ncbi:hypothetical protein PQX77_010503 [Marasmius sp. AFHP31]|nr:hypothetical protein PQX77_010503 [Marasmius sp. AFHP31]
MAELPDPPIDPLFYLDAPLEPYLTQKRGGVAQILTRYQDFWEFKRSHPQEFALLPPPYSIKFAFNNFVDATSRAFLTAQATSPSQTSPGTTTEFEIIAQYLRIRLDMSVPPTDHGSTSNQLEVKRMMLTSVRRFAELWQNCLPDDVDKRLLFEDILRFIREEADARRKDDLVKLRLGEGVFGYRNAKWKDLERDLESSGWIRWRNGLIQQE